MINSYLETISLVERLHREVLEVIKADLDRNGIRDLNNVQALILFKIGDDELTVGELTNRGYYLGSNVSYNVKKMVENGYLVQERSLHDRRAIHVRLSPKALAVRAKMQAMFERHVAQLGQGVLKADDFDAANSVLRRLEQFWAGNLSYPMRLPADRVSSAA
ncbi:MAG: winged helix-turn-helix transcriptional regulator [Rhodospirillaceae bacterium]|nr:winged helix-turn-helix transcriptional regulator [Rhodospirillaceae bacterium]